MVDIIAEASNLESTIYKLAKGFSSADSSVNQASNSA